MTPLPVTTTELARLHPLSGLGEENLRHLLPLCRRERCPRGLDPLRRQDARGQIVYLIRGELKVDRPDGVIRVIVGGTDQAAAPFARTGQEPLASKAITDIEILRVNEEALDIMVTWGQVATQDPSHTSTFEASNWRLMSGMFSARNLAFGAFSSLPPAHIDTLLQRFERWPVLRDQVVIREGDTGDYYYLIERGRCRVTREVAGDLIEVAELHAGDAFGEEALVADVPRNATVTMLTDGVLLRLAKDDFVELLRAPLLSTCTTEAAIGKVRAGAQLLDVRFPAEFIEDGLPGAINMPLNELRQGLAGMDKNREYIAYCQSGRRSAAAVFLMSQRGFRVQWLSGGLRALSGTALMQEGAGQ